MAEDGSDNTWSDTGSGICAPEGDAVVSYTEEMMVGEHVGSQLGDASGSAGSCGATLGRLSVSSCVSPTEPTASGVRQAPTMPMTRDMPQAASVPTPISSTNGDVAVNGECSVPLLDARDAEYLGTHIVTWSVCGVPDGDKPRFAQEVIERDWDVLVVQEYTNLITEGGVASMQANSNVVVSEYNPSSARRGQAIFARPSAGAPTCIHQCEWALFCLLPGFSLVVGSLYLPQRGWGMDTFHQACLEAIAAGRRAQAAAKYANALTSDPPIVFGCGFNYEIHEVEMDLMSADVLQHLA